MTQPLPLDAAATEQLDAVAKRLCSQLSSHVSAEALAKGVPVAAPDEAIGSSSVEIIGVDGTRYSVMVIAYPPAPAQP